MPSSASKAARAALAICSRWLVAEPEQGAVVLGAHLADPGQFQQAAAGARVAEGLKGFACLIGGGHPAAWGKEGDLRRRSHDRPSRRLV
jgi:hypothetical protein